MLSAATIGQRTLNLVITGQVRCGSTILQTSINAHPDVICHSDLLHPDPAVRHELHEQYFGPPEDDHVPEHYDRACISPEHYLTTRIFDCPLGGEKVVGVKLLYPQLQEHDLWQYCQDRCRSGDFCVVHVTRNPVACFVSLKQAQSSGAWVKFADDSKSMTVAAPVRIDIKELTEFCRWHAAYELRIRQYCDDRVELPYRELFCNYREAMRGVFRYLELSPLYQVSPGTRRLKNRQIPERILNFDQVRARVPHDVRGYFDADDLF